MKNVKFGYLPLYNKMYDEKTPQYRATIDPYMKRTADLLEENGLELVRAPICRIHEEFMAAAEMFNQAGVAAVITHHLAYSPSQESIEALLSLEAPIIVFDTTPDYELIAVAAKEKRISFNHGIHGVQDMCNLLSRNGRDYTICAGHILKNDVLGQLVRACRAAALKYAFNHARVGSAGGVFPGMGDFQITPDRYQKLGIVTKELTPADAETYLPQVTEEELDLEEKYDKEHYTVEVKNAAEYRECLRAGLALRKWMAAEELTACTVNFLHVNKSGLTKMPFIECCKILERGQGYAGEGDMLTAALTGALATVYPDTTFTEIFCPDWERDVLLLSHMGESNPRLGQWKSVLADVKFVYNNTGDTAALYTCLRPGKAVLVNLAPMQEEFRLILSEVEMLDAGLEDGAYRYSNQGWLRPGKPLPEFLKEYSMFGGTHHSALVYGGDLEELSCFGKMMGFDVRIIR